MTTYTNEQGQTVNVYEVTPKTKKASPKEAEFKALLERAQINGRKKVESLEVNPMVVTDGVQNWFVADGSCGFAWVVIRPGNCAFANWLKKKEIARAHYYGGVQIWISAYNQSMQKKMAFAEGMAEVFKEAGIEAHADSRMD